MRPSVGARAKIAIGSVTSAQWGWSCGFYPRTDPGEHRSGIAETFEEARAGFQAAWQELAATRTGADFEAWRRQRDWPAWKDRMHDLALPLPTQRPEGIARCFCGEVITNPTLHDHVRTAHHLTAA